MGATRKLQGEIDKVLKKVQEGVDVFDSIWNKVYDTENANQKEKFEADLKKEIKKLQRYRDQIKTWLQSSEIKDKKALLDARKLIEKEMERFKVCEKETKTKAFSKEGLGQQPKTDPREKAKSESRDWLNNMVSELESQMDSFEAEIERLTVKKSRNLPPRLGHLEESINRHKAHIVKLEQILRLLDNDGVSPDQVNEIKIFIEDYVERNQDDFEDFSEVDELYSSIPIEKIEALEMDAIATAASALMVKIPKDVLPVVPEESTLQASVESGAKTPPLQIQQDGSAIGVTGAIPTGISAVSTTNGGTGISVGSPTILTSSRVGKSNNPSVPSSPVAFSSTVNEEGGGSYFGQNPNLSRGVGRGGLPISVNSVPSSPLVATAMSSSSSAVTSSSHVITSSIQDLSKRSPLPSEERLTTGGSSTDGGIIGTRLFTSPGGQWRSPAALPFQSTETGQYVARTEIQPDQKQKFLQRLQQVSQQQQQNNPLLASAQQISHLGATSQKQQNLKSDAKQSFPRENNLSKFNENSENSKFKSTMKARLIPNQHTSLQPSHAGVLQQQQSGLNLGVQPQAANSPTTLAQTGLEALQLPATQASQQILLPSGVSVKENETSADRIGELSQSGLQHKLSDDIGGSSSLPEMSRWASSNVEPSNQSMPSSQVSVAGPGIIGRRSTTDLGAIGDNLINTAANDQLYNLQMLDAAFHKIPLPKDSEQLRSYTPRHPAVTPSSYPQAPAELIDNPVFWERLGTDVLFFAFYYQQGTYQQYLAARELKKQSWRYHKKYNTWFQRHEEPKVTTDEFEQGTYVYFDFHILHDDFQQGWCQRIKTEFTFEYSYLEDELVV